MSRTGIFITFRVKLGTSKKRSRSSHFHMFLVLNLIYSNSDKIFEI